MGVHDERADGPEDVAAEFIALRTGGEPADESSFVARLATDAERDEFRTLVRQAERAERSLPRALTPDTRIRGRYRILAEIGSGGMGRVFAAFDEELQRKVAVKVLSALNAGQPDREEMFLKESRLLAALQHPNIVAVHEAGRDGDLTFIVMDLVDGTSLSDVIGRARTELEARTSAGGLVPRDGALLERAIGKKMPDGRPNLIVPRDWYASVANTMLELARTLEAAHGQRVLHRDLKPGNVMLLGGASPVVLDFGLAGSIDMKAGAVTEGLYGSVAYLAPEQARTQQVGMDPRTDVYQLGLILYELLTLRRAFAGNVIGEVLEKIRLGDIQAPRAVNPAVPRDLDAICMMALELAPERRYPSARALREDIERYVEGREAPLAARSSKLRAAARRSRYLARKHPAIAAVVGAVLLGAIGVFAVPAQDPGRSSTFYRLNLADEKVIPITSNKRIVRPGEWLAKDIESVGTSFVYTLSVFGPDKDTRYVYPYRAVFQDHMERLERPNEPWGLQVDERSGKVLCTKIEKSHNKFEGLIVMQSPRERHELESWMDQLVRNAGETGVPYATAVGFLEREFAETRGVPKSTWSDSEREAIRRLLAKDDAKQAKKKFDLPGVEEFEIECEVAGQ